MIVKTSEGYLWLHTLDELKRYETPIEVIERDYIPIGGMYLAKCTMRYDVLISFLDIGTYDYAIPQAWWELNGKPEGVWCYDTTVEPDPQWHPEWYQGDQEDRYCHPYSRGGFLSIDEITRRFFAKLEVFLAENSAEADKVIAV